MVSYFDAISPELTNGNITLAEINADGIHPTDLGHAYAAQFLEQNLLTAINNFPPGTVLEPIPPTQTPLYSSDFEFTSLVDGTGANGPSLNPTSNQGWFAQSDPTLEYPGSGLQSSTPGSTLDFTVTGKEILIGYWLDGGPMGQASHHRGRRCRPDPGWLDRRDWGWLSRYEPRRERPHEWRTPSSCRSAEHRRQGQHRQHLPPPLCWGGGLQ